jgi:hypothetical protein
VVGEPRVRSGDSRQIKHRAGPAPVQHERQLAAVAQAARWPTSPSPAALAAGAADRSRAVAPGVDKAGEKVALPVEDLDGFAE